jgi:hypothetical protein
LRIFISYRRSDAPSASRQLAEALKLRFGSENVFLDTRDVAAGTEWRSDAVRRVQASDVVLVVIGPHWTAAADDRAHRIRLDPAAEDVVRLEVETAFTHGGIVIPVLVDDADMPAREALPRPFRPLAGAQAQTLHHASWERDFEALVEVLADLATPSRPQEPPPAPTARPRVTVGRSDAERVASYIAEGSVVTVVGSGANAVDRNGPWRHGAGSLPDASELARQLVRRFGVGSETDDLARISQYVCLLDGKIDLYRALRELLIRVDCDPSSVHRCLARVPARLRDSGRERYQLLVTTNYDTALERAFDAAHEPYDLAVFAASGEHSGRFVHVPWADDGHGSRPITVPNEYVDLPIDEGGTLERTVIVKLHGGGVDVGNGAPRVRDTFVITEDDYIGYLTQGPVESLIPLQILNKIRDSHFLFLGYRVRDWTLRVFLQRIWGDEQLEARSWAVDPGPDVVERELWDDFGVNVVEAPLAGFMGDVERELGRLPGTHEP